MPTDVTLRPNLFGALRPPAGQSLRGKIRLYQGVVAAMLLATAGATMLAVERIDYQFDRGRLASGQMETMLRVAAQMNRHSENVAELLVLGRTELSDLDETRRAVDDGLDDLELLVERELRLIRSEAEREDEGTERARVARMRALYEEIDGAAGELLGLSDLGQLSEAATLFRERIEEGASAELDLVIAEVLADEEAELVGIQAQASRLKLRLMLLAGTVSLLALGVSAFAGARLTRALGQPIGELVAGTRAIGEGDLGARIGEGQPEEFADLARQFNATAARLEAQRRELLDTQAGLEAEVARRTGELGEANARLQRLDHMRMLFLADIGHELRTPLTVLRGEAEVALRGERPVEEHREALRRVVQLAGQMGRLVEDLLFLARAEVGAVRFDMEPLALQDVLEVALLDGHVLAEARGIELDAEIEADTLRVEGDAGRLAQAMRIVLDNAVKYSEPGGRVEVNLRREGREAVLRVVNGGPGIPAADLPFVFNRFYRGRQEGTPRREGAGLGLPIAKWVLDTHGGRIGLSSAEGRTEATLRLPLLG